MDKFQDELKSLVNEEQASRDLISESKINELEVPPMFQGIKARIRGVLEFRNVNQDLDPNMHELMDIMLNLNNDLADYNLDEDKADDLKHAFNVLYDNVIQDGMIKNKLGNTKSNIYKMFETVKGNLDMPTAYNQRQAEYLKVLSSVNNYQRQQLRQNEIVGPNDYEKVIIANSENLNLPESIKDISDAVKTDIDNPERMKELDKEMTI